MSQDVDFTPFGLEDSVKVPYFHVRYAEKYTDRQKAEQWKNLLESIGTALEQSGHKIYWRIRPSVKTNRDFEENTENYIVRARYSIGPKDD